MIVLGVAVAGAIGAVARYLVDRTVQQRFELFPVGTLVVNLSGSVVLGFITGLALYHGLSSRVTIVLGTGFLGAYTTLSTLSFESFRLLEDGALVTGLANLGVSLVAGLLAAGAGVALGAAV